MRYIPSFGKPDPLNPNLSINTAYVVLNNRIYSSIAAVLIMAGALSPLTALATDRYVSPAGNDLNTPFTSWAAPAKTISAAITACSATGDTIWVTNGTYTLSSKIIINKAVALKSVNGPEQTIIDGNDTCQCIYISVPDASVEGFTLTNANNKTTLLGGAIFTYFLSGESTISNCIISGNKANTTSGQGGAAYLKYGGILIDCQINNNSAPLGGGGVYCLLGGTMINCTISNNTVSAGNGGGVCMDSSDGYASNCTITANSLSTGYNGAGVYLNSAGTVYNCNISSNTGSSLGGGIYFNNGGKAYSSTIAGHDAVTSGGGIYMNNGGIIIDCIVSNNTVSAGNGGGIYVATSGFASNCTITANNLDTNYFGAGIYFSGGGTLHNSTVSTNTGANRGGGIYFNNGGAVYSSSITRHNAVTYGGGVYIKSVGTLSGSTVSQNFSGYDGGGVFLDKGGAIDNCTIENNIANNTLVETGFGGGGGAYILTNGTIETSIIRNNSVLNLSDGGAIYFAGGGTVTDCSILNNTSLEGYGGGILIDSAGTLDRCIVTDNSAQAFYGGGIFSDAGGIVRNCVINKNTASDYGGGVYADGGTYQNCTVVDNEAINFSSSGGGLYCANGTVENCIIYYNTSDINYNYFTNITVTIANSCSTPLPLGTGNRSDAPGFVDFPYEYHLASGSPCIDDGVNQGWMTLDVDGHTRRYAAGTVDMGADEFIPAPGGFVADAGGPHTASSGEIVTLDGSASTRNSADPLQYRWDFGDSTAPGDWTSNPVILHTYNSTGTFTATLLILNDEALDLDTCTVTITNAPPLIDAGGPYSSFAREPVTVTPIGQKAGPAEALEYRHNFGDGWSSWTTTTNASHIFTNEGLTNYTVEVREVLDEIFHEYGLTNSDSGNITVNQGLTAVINPVTATGEGTQASFSGSKTAGSSGSLLYRWDPGDGSGWSDWSGSTNGQYIYSDDSGAGTYLLLYQVSNTYTWSEASTTVKITNLPPTVTGALLSTNEIWMGDTFTVSASATDPSTNDLLMYSFNLDGSWSGWAATNNIDHSFTNGGLQTLEVRAKDGDGGTSTLWSAEIDVIVATAGSTALTNGNDFAVTWDVITNQQYTVQRTFNLVNPSWSNITAIIPAVSNNITFVETNTFPEAFYRILLNP